MKYTKTNKQILSESGRTMNQSIIQQSRFYGENYLPTIINDNYN